MEKTGDEFTKLQREFRHMELNRKSYADESYQVLRKQQATIAKLKAESDALKQELAMETRRKTMKPDQLAEAGRMHEEYDKYAAFVEEEKVEIARLDDEIVALKRKQIQLRKDMGGINAARENQAMVQKQIKILENRLDQALVKFNQALAQNKSLRETIDDLRRERVVFDNIYRKLERELHEKKKQMANVIEVSNQAYEQRDNFQMEIAAIEQANRKEQDDFEAQMLELARLLETDLQIPAPNLTGTPAGVITQPSSSKRLLTSGDEKPSSSKKPGTTPTTTTEKQQQQLLLPAPETPQQQQQAATLKEKQELQHGEERVQNFEEAFNRIKTATGISSIDELVRTFIKNEDQNFSLFNYVNEQTNEIEKLEERIQQLKDEEAKYAQESGDDANQHKQIILDLEAKTKTTLDQAEKLEAKADEYQNILDQLKVVIARTYTKTERVDQRRKNGGNNDMLAESTVTEANMLQYLAVIEERVNIIIHDYLAVKARQAAKAAAQNSDTAEPAPLAVLGVGPTTPMGQDLIHVNPPKLEDYSSEDDDDDDDGDTRPLTRAELKAKTLNRLYRRGNSPVSQAATGNPSSPKASVVKVPGPLSSGGGKKK